MCSFFSHWISTRNNVSLLLFHFCDKTPWSRHLRKYLIWGLQLQRVRVHDHHGREHGSRQRVMALEQRGNLGTSWAFETSKRASSDTPPLTQPHPLIISKQFPKLRIKHSKMSLSRPFSFKAPSNVSSIFTKKISTTN